MSQVHTQEEYGLRPEAAEFPMMLVLSFVYPCNALCPHCPYTNSNIRKEYRDAPVMPEAIFKKIADESGPFGAYLRISGRRRAHAASAGTELPRLCQEGRLQDRPDHQRLAVHRENSTPCSKPAST